MRSAGVAEKELGGRNPTSEEACPSCNAKPGSSCRDSSGGAVAPHGGRDQPVGVIFWRDRQSGELIAAESRVDALDRQLGWPLSSDTAQRVVVAVAGERGPADEEVTGWEAASRFILTIGDWSDDGHGKAEDFQVEADVDLEEVRRLYLLSRDAADTHPENVCSEYEEPSLSRGELISLGLREDDLGEVEAGEKGGWHLSPENMARLWVAWMNSHTSASLRLAETPDSLPTLHWYGRRRILTDKETDHVGFIGYGAF